jgi:hypothetical protein
MAFRNPINSLPASAITGTISAGQLGVGSVTGPSRFTTRPYGPPT